ncbi:MAG TPA: tetratricopeptide repeat protein [Acidobacteriota bacterium]|nr:tetratricopeptide repeat protein [Acidobacteriota bacterium]
MTHSRPADERLESWKEIAAYLDRDVRTVQRWEKREGLPIHRHEHQKRGTVFAFRDEIDEWLRLRSSPPQDPSGRPTWPIPAGLVALALALLTAWWMWPASDSRQRLTIAVLPFQNVGGEPDFFSQGLTEELITRLGRLAPTQLGVIASTSALHYLRTSKPVPEIASELDADYVIEGAVRRSPSPTGLKPGDDESAASPSAGQQLRIDVRLIRAADATLVWTHSYDTSLSGSLGLQQELAVTIARALSPSLLSDPPSAQSARAPQNWQVWEAYLRGRFLWNKATRHGFQQALDSFQTALQLDPAYLPAHLGIADTYFLLAHYGLMSGAEAFPKALQAAEAALRTDPQSAEALAATAYARNLVEGKAEDAKSDSIEGLFHQAVALHPRHPGIRRWYGAYLRSRERQEEALEQFQRARQLDPLSPIILLDLGWCHHQLGRYQRALAFYDRVEQLDPAHAKAHYLRGLTFTAMGRYAEAIASLETAVPLSDNSPHYLYSLADAYLKAEQPQQAARILDRLQEIAARRHVSPRLLEKLQSRISAHPDLTKR